MQDFVHQQYYLLCVSFDSAGEHGHEQMLYSIEFDSVYFKFNVRAYISNPSSSIPMLQEPQGFICSYPGKRALQVILKRSMGS